MYYINHMFVVIVFFVIIHVCDLVQQYAFLSNNLAYFDLLT